MGCISFFRHLKFPTQFLSEKWNTICHTFPTSRFSDISIFRQFFSSNTYNTVILIIPWFFLKVLQKSSIWICFTTFIQYHWKVYLTNFFFRIFKCIEVILYKWVRVFRWAFGQMSFITFLIYDLNVFNIICRSHFLKFSLCLCTRTSYTKEITILFVHPCSCSWFSSSSGFNICISCKRPIILVFCNIGKTVGKMRCRQNEMSEKRDKKCIIFPTEIVSEIWDVGKMRPPPLKLDQS